MKKLDFSAAETEQVDHGKRNRRWSRHDANPTVQMSVRMPEEVYDSFRALCEKERRTNGAMLEILLNEYLIKHDLKV